VGLRTVSVVDVELDNATVKDGVIQQLCEAKELWLGLIGTLADIFTPVLRRHAIGGCA